MGKIKDLSGQQFGCLQVISLNTEKTDRVYWNYKCTLCGAEGVIRSDGLKRLPKNCKDCRYGTLLNKTFGKLTVLKQGKIDKNGHRYWICKCECGNIKEVSGTNLIEGKIISCGCEHKRIVSQKLTKDLIGQKFGQLTVLQRVSDIGEQIKWLCQCECGTKTIVTGGNLKSGHTTSCGCIHSKGEKKIRDILNSLNIKFQTEYIFPELPDRRFDFVIFDKDNRIKFVIEYDGKQHFSFVNTWHQSQEEFIQAQKRDQEKTDFCLNNKLNLIRIPYYDYDKLNQKYLLNLLLENERKIIC